MDGTQKNVVTSSHEPTSWYHNHNKTASFQKEAMRTQVALYFFMKWNLYRVVSLCLNKQNVQNRQVEKSLLL